MPDEHSNRQFSQLITQQLPHDIRELWMPMADNFDREGPEAVKIYLDAEQERLKGIIDDLIERFKER